MRFLPNKQEAFPKILPDTIELKADIKFCPLQAHS
jgi:hypothetical protein